jgi:hypothetical protein
LDARIDALSHAANPENPNRDQGAVDEIVELRRIRSQIVALEEAELLAIGDEVVAFTQEDQ